MLDVVSEVSHSRDPEILTTIPKTKDREGQFKMSRKSLAINYLETFCSAAFCITLHCRQLTLVIWGAVWVQFKWESRFVFVFSPILI
jgi:hypothetical protein